MFRKLVMMLFALAVGTSALTLTGCNTVSGAGKDVGFSVCPPLDLREMTTNSTTTTRTTTAIIV